MDVNNIYMERALQLASLGEGLVSPNPMVGAVIVAGDRIIGEGYHHRFGGPHAEVNAINSVEHKDRHLLKNATIYVTLEPCSHYGKTPPCAKLIIDTGIPGVVIGAPDPNPKVNGRGISMMRDAGIKVTEGVMADKCIDLNHRFMTAQLYHRPYIQLKWAATADGFLASPEEMPRLLISNPLSSVLMHRERAKADAIFVGTNTLITDNPRLDCRLWPGKNPVPLSFDSPRLPSDAHILSRNPILKNVDENFTDFFHRLFKEGINSVMVEGGRSTLQSLIDLDLLDEIRVETSSATLNEILDIPPSLKINKELHSLRIPSLNFAHLAERGFVKSFSHIAEGNTIITFRRPMTLQTIRSCDN